MFNTICWYLNVLHLSWFVAFVRFVLHMALRAHAVESVYEATDNVGYHGWIDLPWFGAVAFRRPDGTLQYRW